MAAQNGDTLSVHYVGTLDDGTEFDSSIGNEPLKFTLGRGDLIPGFEKALLGKEVGDKVTATLPPEEAYGMPNENMTLVVPRNQLPEDIEPEVGMILNVTVEDREIDVTITRLDDNEIELDGNHPLAGQTLTFNIEILEINK